MMMPDLENTPRILCVDDNADLLLMLKHVLCARGFEVTVAASGAEALNLLPATDFDVVVLDYEMPEMNGGVVAERIREARPEQAIVLFSASAHEVPDSVVPLVDAMISKSQPLSKLVDILDELTDRRTERRASPRRPLQATVAVTGIGETAVHVAGIATDLSAGGIGISAPLKVMTGDEVALEIAIPAATTPVKARAEVRHRFADRIGLAFRGMSDEDWMRVVRFARG